MWTNICLWYISIYSVQKTTLYPNLCMISVRLCNVINGEQILHLLYQYVCLQWSAFSWQWMVTIILYVRKQRCFQECCWHVMLNMVSAPVESGTENQAGKSEIASPNPILYSVTWPLRSLIKDWTGTKMCVWVSVRLCKCCKGSLQKSLVDSLLDVLLLNKFAQSCIRIFRNGVFHHLNQRPQVTL